MVSHGPLEWRARLAPIELTAADKALDANRMDMCGKMPLMAAVEDVKPSVKEIKQLCADGAIIDAVNRKGHTALSIASFRGLTAIVKVLLDYDADINFGTSAANRLFRGFTPLMLAAQAGRTETTRVLILRGAEGDRVSCGSGGSFQVVRPGSNVMDLMCSVIDERYPRHANINAATRSLLHRRCCRVCGTTSQNLEVRYDAYIDGGRVGSAPQQNLHRCDGCPIDIFKGTARYCSRVC